MTRFARMTQQGHFSRVLALSVGTGIIVALVVAAFEQVTAEGLLEPVLERPLWQVCLAPGVGLVLSALILRYIARDPSPSTSDEYIRAFHERHPRLPLLAMPARLLAGVTTIGSGGALGLEGPSIYAGASLGLGVHGRLGRFVRREDAKLLLTAGAAAGVAAVFKAPATGVIFALEVPYRDDLTRAGLLPALVASASSYATYVALLGSDPVVPFVGGDNPEFGVELSDLLGGLVLGIAAGLAGRAFAWLVRRAKQYAVARPVVERIALASIVLALLAWISDVAFDETLTIGPGFEAMGWMLEHDELGLIALLFGLRVVATVATVGASGVGGLFIPLATLGVVMGGFVGETVNASEPRLYLILGLAAFLGAGYRTPIAAVMFVAESQGGSAFVVPALIAAAASQLVAGHSSVASYQRAVRLGHLERRFTLPLTSALTTEVLTVPSDATVAEFVFVHVLGRRERVVPVVDGGTYVGIITLDQIGVIDRAEWEHTTVSELMATDMVAGLPSWTLRDAVVSMEEADLDLLPVTDADRIFVGVVRADDIVKLDEILDETGG